MKHITAVEDVTVANALLARLARTCGVRVPTVMLMFMRVMTLRKYRSMTWLENSSPK